MCALPENVTFKALCSTYSILNPEQFQVPHTILQLFKPLSLKSTNLTHF